MASTERMSRRDLFRVAAVSSIATACGIVGPRRPRVAAAATPSTPQEALQALRDGNNRYATTIGSTNHMTSFDEDLAEIRAHTEGSQQPYAALLSCADSRVAPELIFDESLNRLFVCRVAGNIVTPEIIASLEYAVVALGTVKAVMVLGHGNCGAVSAANSLTRVANTQISALYALLRAGVTLGGSGVDNQSRANARVQAALLTTSSPAISDALKTGQVAVVPAYYDVASGRVTELPPIVGVTATP